MSLNFCSGIDDAILFPHILSDTLLETKLNPGFPVYCVKQRSMCSEMVSNGNISNINGSSATVISEAPLQVPDYYTEPAGAVIGRLTFEATLAMVGVLGNMLVCLVIARMKTKSAINRYLFNLAIADIGVLIVVFPIAVLQEQIRSYFPLGRGVCLYVYPVIDTFYSASIWLVASVAVERYINIVKRVKAYRNRSLKTTTFAIVAIWLISFSVISLPLFFVIEFKEETSACFINWFKTPSLFFGGRFTLFLLPCLHMLYPYRSFPGLMFKLEGE